MVKVTYTTQRGMVDYFMNLCDLPRGEVWGHLKDCSNKCIERLEANKKQKSSWFETKFDGSDIALRVDVDRIWEYDRKTYTQLDTYVYSCRIKFKGWGEDKETFTSKQVDEYLIEKVLLA